MDISGQIAIVTGGGSGLGAAAARALCEQGARVVIFDRDAQQGQAIASDLGGLFVPVDVAVDQSVQDAFDVSRQRMGQERILLCCAGIGDAWKTAERDRETGTITPHPMDAFRKTLDVNLIGTFRCVSLAAAGMLTLPPYNRGERGAIVTTASIAAQDGQKGQAAYAASKAGVVGMTLPIARDLANDGIRINTILPGIFETPMVGRLPVHVRQSLSDLVPCPRRMGDPAEYASLAVEMIRNGYLNGECVRLDGALRMPPR